MSCEPTFSPHGDVFFCMERLFEPAGLPGSRAAAYAEEARDARLLARRAGLEPAGRVAAVAPHLSEIQK